MVVFEGAFCEINNVVNPPAVADRYTDDLGGGGIEGAIGYVYG